MRYDGLNHVLYHIFPAMKRKNEEIYQAEKAGISRIAYGVIRQDVVYCTKFVHNISAFRGCHTQRIRS